MKNLSLFLIIVCAFGLADAQTSQTDEATLLSAQAVKLFKEKRYREAIPAAEKVVSLRERERGANHIETGEALRNLGFIRQANGDKKEAGEALEKAVAVYRANPDLTRDRQIQLAQMLETVAFYKFENRKIEKAKEFYEQAAELNEKIYGQDSPETINSLWALGKIYQFRKDYKNAEKSYRRVLEIRMKKPAANNWEIQTAESHYYCMSVRNDNGEEASNFIKSLNPDETGAAQNQTNSNPKFVRGGIINGKATYLAPPQYPVEARNMRASGAVNVQTTIDETGKVIFACAVSGNKILFEASETAAYRSTFKPTTLSGQPVKVTGFITYNFVP